MTTITSITPKTYDGKITGYSVVLSDGVNGYLDDKASDKDLKQGEQVTYTSANKTNKKGGTYILLSIRRGSSVATPQPSSGMGLPVKTPLPVQSKVDHKIEAALRSMEYCMKVYGEERQGFDWDVVLSKQREIVQTLWSEIDEIYSEK